MSQVEFLTKQLYGSKSEKLDPNQSELFEEGVEMGKPEPLPDVPADEPEEENSSKEKAKTTRRKKADIFPQNLKVEVVQTSTPQEVLENPELFRKIGERFHDLLHHQKEELLWQRTVTEQYVRVDEKTEVPVSPPAPLPPVPGAAITPELAAHLIIAKYCDHLPHYRQAVMWKRELDIQLNRQTLNQWTHAIAEHLKGVAEAIGRELRLSEVLQLDETPIDYLSPGAGKAKKGYYWVMRNPETKAVYYHWETTRGKDGLKRTLGWGQTSNTIDFRGTIQCDGYGVYTSLQKELAGLKMGGCLAHIRRKFLRDGSIRTLSWSAEWLSKVQILYRIERELKESQAPPDERRKIRQKRSKPIVTQLKATLVEQKPNYRPKSAIGEAIRYALSQWSCFERYLEDGKLEIDNNGVENAIRPTKLGAKNHLFIGSAEAGTNSAVLYTLVENCRALGLNPRDYLIWAINGLQAKPAEKLTPACLSHQIQDTKSLAA